MRSPSPAPPAAVPAAVPAAAPAAVPPAVPPAVSAPALAPVPTYLPWGRTARRLDWAHLPPQVRFEAEAALGSRVVADETLTHGYLPTVESLVTCADGSRHLVRAASAKAQRGFAGLLRAQAGWLRALPADAPVVPLEHVLDGDWVVLVLPPVGTSPARPWREEELARCLATLERLAVVPPPDGLRPFAEDLADWLGRWDLLEERDDLGTPGQRATAARLAARLPDATAGGALVHTDLRDDTLRLLDGEVLLDGWSWPVRGAAWLDSLLLLVGPCGDGVDVEAVLRRSPLLAAAPPDHVDSVLAAMAGFFLTSCDLPVPPSSPWQREFQRWQGEAVWGWLRRRRGWS